MVHVVNGWIQVELEEVCGSEHIWLLYEVDMPCLCGKLWLRRTGNQLWQMPAARENAPNIAQRFGSVMSHFIVGECNCHPPTTAQAPRDEGYVNG